MWKEINEHNFAQLQEGNVLGKLVMYQQKRLRTQHSHLTDEMMKELYIIEKIDHTSGKVQLTEKSYGIKKLKKQRAMLLNANFFYRL